MKGIKECKDTALFDNRSGLVLESRIMFTLSFVDRQCLANAQVPDT